MTTQEIPFRLSLTCAATKHGTANAYAAYRCRCATAREAWRIYNKRRREGRNIPHCIDGTGAARRLQALVALGWNFRTLARKAGYHHRTIQDVAYTRRNAITRHTAQWVSDLYEQLSATPGGSKYALTVAARNNWCPPLAWEGIDIDDPKAQPIVDTACDDDPNSYDPITVGFAVEGRLTYEQIHSSLPDLIETVRRLATRYGDHEIVQLLRWPGANDHRPDSRTRAQNSLHKFRQRHGIPGREKHEAVYAYGTRSRARKAA